MWCVSRVSIIPELGGSAQGFSTQLLVIRIHLALPLPLGPEPTFFQLTDNELLC